MYYDADKLSTVLLEIKARRKITNDELGKSIGVSGSQISYVINKKKGLSPKSLRNLCEKYSIDPDTLRDSKETIQKIGTILSKRLQEKRIHLSDLSKGTELHIFDLSDIVSNKREPTRDELKKIAEFLQIDAKILLNKDYLNNIVKIRLALEDMNMNPNHIDAIISFIESNI